jgi:hypothetical protein
VTGDDLAARVQRLESIDAIRQLVSRYALALDKRDVQTMASLFVDDVRTHDGRSGRAALADWFGQILRAHRTTFHLVGNHIIDFVDDDHAAGIVTFRPEHEVGEYWIVMPAQYWDRYERRGDEWCFRSRSVHAFYAADLLENPTALPNRWHFPDNPFIDHADLPERWDTWQQFWGEAGS